METRTTKFNLKFFLEDYLFAHESGEEEECEGLEEGFKLFYSNSSLLVQKGVKNYLKTSTLVTGYPFIKKMVTKNVPNFAK